MTHTSHAFTSSSEMGREPYLSPCTRQHPVQPGHERQTPRLITDASHAQGYLDMQSISGCLYQAPRMRTECVTAGSDECYHTSRVA